MGNYSCQVRGDLEDDQLPNRFLDTKTARNTSQFSLWLLEAAGSALIAAGLVDDEGNPLLDLLPGGSVIGTCVGGCYDDLLAAYDTFNTRGHDKLSPHLHVKFPLNMASYTVQWRFGMGGPSNTVSTACATGTQAIGEAFHIVQAGIAPIMVAGASESTVHPMGVAGFSAMRALVTDSNEDPERALRPFDITRAGFALGEGAGALVLEDYDFAMARGAKVFAEIVGFASSNDAYHPIAPQPDGIGAARAMVAALADAGVKPDQIGHMQAHAASTPAGDIAEARAIHRMSRRARNIDAGHVGQRQHRALHGWCRRHRKRDGYSVARRTAHSAHRQLPQSRSRNRARCRSRSTAQTARRSTTWPSTDSGSVAKMPA